MKVALRFEDEKILKGARLNGNKGSIREELMMYVGLSLTEIIKLSLKIEKRNQAWMEEGFGLRSSSVNNGPNRMVLAQRWSGEGGPTQTRGSVGNGSNEKRPPSFGNLTSSPQLCNNETKGSRGGNRMTVHSSHTSNDNSRLGGSWKQLLQRVIQEKREQSLCFKCNDRGSPGHQCRFKHLQLVVVEEEEEDHGRGGEGADIPVTQLEEDEEMALQLSMQSLMGLTSSQVIIMVDCGASNNLIRKDKGCHGRRQLQGVLASREDDKIGSMLNISLLESTQIKRQLLTSQYKGCGVLQFKQ